MCDRSDVFEGKRLELVLFEEIVQVLLQHLKNEARVVFVREALVRSNKVEFVRIFLAAKIVVKNGSTLSLLNLGLMSFC